MARFARPRTAVIGLATSAVAPYEGFFGEIRSFESIDQYLNGFNWTETDILITSASNYSNSEVLVPHALLLGPNEFWFKFINSAGTPRARSVSSDYGNTERELSISPNCPDEYKIPARNLVRKLQTSDGPPTAVATSWLTKPSEVLVATTSGSPIAIRHARPDGRVILTLPKSAEFADWIPAFLSDIHRIDKKRVPQPPPKYAEAVHWYTPEQKRIAASINEIDEKLVGLNERRLQYQAALLEAEEESLNGAKRAIWADGEQLVHAVKGILGRIGFGVRDMDLELEQGEAKREDLRITYAQSNGWEAIVEVKSYVHGTRTNDGEFIRSYRDAYRDSEGRFPDSTFWIANPFRTRDPSARPAPDRNVEDTAKIIGAVYLLTTDLFRLWVQLEEGSLAASTLIRRLMDEKPGRMKIE
ncbi:MAG: hypothetical protein OXG77_02125 [Chloroflexi bacterium]|nr:hypothetical protein [Chloroflexota bacterium]